MIESLEEGPGIGKADSEHGTELRAPLSGIGGARKIMQNEIGSTETLRRRPVHRAHLFQCPADRIRLRLLDADILIGRSFLRRHKGVLCLRKAARKIGPYPLAGRVRISQNDDSPFLIRLLDALKRLRLEIKSLGNDAVRLDRLVHGHYIHLALDNQYFLYHSPVPSCLRSSTGRTA